MKKRLPPWCKLVKHTLIDKDMDVSELATKTGLARPYVEKIKEKALPEIESIFSEDS